jgi:hypothetical protein
MTKQTKQGVTTTSWLRMWWLTTILGYRVASATRMPRQATFGQIRYNSTWHLKKAPR